MRLKLFALVAALWLFLGVFCVMYFLPQSFSSGWKPILVTFVFGPSAWLLLDWAGKSGKLLPQSINTWRPLWRISFMIISSVTLVVVLTAIYQFFIRPLI